MRIALKRLFAADIHSKTARSHVIACSSFDDFLAANPLPGRHVASFSRLGPINLDQYTATQFHWRETPEIVSRLLAQGDGDLQWLKDPSKGRFLAQDPSTEDITCIITLPSVFLFALNIPEDEWQRPPTAEQELCHVAALGSDVKIGKQAMVLLSADSIALGIWNDDLFLKHKILTGYTVRRSQGKSQLKHLRQGGGGHSVGGSIRAQESRRLFQAGATKLYEWRNDLEEATLLFKGGDVRNWNELYAATAPAVPVARDDCRWQPAGVGVRRPRLSDLESIRKKLE